MNTVPTERKIFRRKKRVTFATCGADICFVQGPLRMVWEENLYIENNEKSIRLTLNENTLPWEREMTLPVKEGDCLEIFRKEQSIKITFFLKTFAIDAPKGSYTFHIAEEKTDGYFEDFPKYTRSPRMIKKVPDEKIEIKSPPQKSQISKTSLVQIIVTPLIMLAITIAMSIVMKRGIYVIMSIASTIVSLVASVCKYIHDKKANKEKNERRKELYEKYLLDMRKKINHKRQEEIEAYQYNQPEVQKIENMIREYSSRIYERNPRDDDFLTFSIGYVKSDVNFEVALNYNELSMEQDELEQEAKRIKDNLTSIERKPVVIDLKNTHLGIVGEKDTIHEQLKLIVAQLTFFQSYHDLQIISIYDEKYDSEYKWMRWYPHVKLQGLNMTGLINSEKMRDQVLGSIYQILKERKNKLDENKKEAKFLPHYVFIIDEPKLIADHSIMEYLGKEGDTLGISIIYTASRQPNMPENITTVFALENSEEGKLLLQDREMRNQKVRLNRAGNVSFEEMARNLGVLKHEQGMTSHIPEKITFFDMYGIERPEELCVAARWEKNQSFKTLAVPLGVRGKEDYLFLNLHEKAHGPHGLVAGTTGSGKSEIIQSYILSLGVNFHPYEVGFLLIDYKGGGMASLFKNMPHLLGTITNLDGSESMRAMASIKSELARRQRIFNEYNVNHINSYHKLFRTGKAKEPIPHLFLISDEFAELKKEQPDFMKELVSAARIGRSLGIHLILATQKPSGVVDDQIWTNSRFKLALKVQNEADSKEILKTPDAAFITQPGRAYLQVGNNEIYELFQSAWSGAAYSEDQTQEEVDNRVYLINELGQGELINKDMSENTESEQLKKTQLDVIIEELQDVFNKMNIPPVKKPWLPPLALQIKSPYTIDPDEAYESKEEEIAQIDLAFSIGMADIPEEQLQCEYHVNLLKDGNIAFFAASGYGKTIFLETVILSLALKNSVDNLNFYLFDFGNNALIPFNALPHTADYILMDDKERMTKFMRIMTDEMKERKKLFAEKMVQNFDVYNQSNEIPLKAIIVIIDNYDIVKELGMEVEEFFTKLGRDGAGLGIFMIVTASRAGAIKYTAVNNFKTKIAGYLLDATESFGIVGKSEYKPVEIEGRTLVKMDRVNRMQVYTMMEFDNEIEHNAKLKKLIAAVRDMYPTKSAPRIPVLPEKFMSGMLKDYGECTADIALGLQKEFVEIRGLMRYMSPFLIMGDSSRGKTNMLKVIIEQAINQGITYIFDSAARELYYASSKKNVEYLEAADDIEDFMEDMKEICAKRKEAFEEKVKEDATLLPRTFFETLQPYYVIVDDIDELSMRYASHNKELAELFKMAGETGIAMIITMNTTKAKSFDDLSKWLKTSNNGLVVGSQGNSNIFPMIPSRELPVLGEGMLFNNGTYERLLLPLYESMEADE